MPSKKPQSNKNPLEGAPATEEEGDIDPALMDDLEEDDAFEDEESFEEEESLASPWAAYDEEE